MKNIYLRIQSEKHFTDMPSTNTEENQNATLISNGGQNPLTGCGTITENKTDTHNNDARQNHASFSFLSSSHAEPVEASSLKTSFMKQALHHLQTIMNFFINAFEIFIKGNLKSTIFNKNKPGGLQLVPAAIPNTNILPLNKNAMRNFLPVLNDGKFSLMKRVLRKSIVITIAILIANLFVMNNASGQSCSNNNIGFNGSFGTNSLAICVGATGTDINGGNPSNSETFTWQVSTTSPSSGFSTVSPNPGDQQNWTISSTYYNSVGTYYFRRVVSNNNGGCNGNSDVITLTVNALPATVTVNGGGTFCGSTTISAGNGGSGTIYFQGTTSNGTSTATPSTSQNITSSGTYYFRAQSSSGCWGPEGSAVVTINAAPTSVSITPATGSICNGSNLSLTGSATTTSSLQAIPSGTDDFNGTPTFSATGSNSGGGTIFTQQSSGFNVGFVATWTPPDASKFMLAYAASFGSATTNSILTSPIINTNGYGSLNFTFVHTYKQGNSGAGIVEVSIDGISWTAVKTYTTNQGGAGSWVSDNISLPNSYLNQSNLQIRFNYSSSVSLSSGWWGVDNVFLNGVPLPLFSWSANTAPAVNGLPANAGTPLSSNQNITVNPTVTTIYTMTVQDASTSCSSTSSATISVNTSPSFTTSPTNHTVTYGASSVNFSVTTTGTAPITYQWQVNTGSGFTNISGATAATLNITNPTVAMNGNSYRVVATNTCSSVTSGAATLTVNQAPLSITATNQSKTYGAAFTFAGTEFTSSGLLNGETIGSVTLSSPGTSATAGVSGSPYTITASAPTGGTFDANNYNISYNIGNLTVNPATLTISADNQSKAYGSVFTFAGTEFTSLGLLNGETIGSVNLSSAGSSTTTGVAGSPYAITASAATGGTFNSNNYLITYNTGNLAVTPATLSITADNQSKTYGSIFTFAGTEFTSSGLLNGETIGSVTLLSPGTPATAGVTGNPYAITPSAASGGTFDANNYAISYNNGNLTVNPATLSITADNQSKTYGAAFTFTGTEFTSSGLLNGETIGSVNLTSPGSPATAGVPGNPYAITASAAAGGTFDANNYTISYNDGNLIVNPATLTISADNQSKTYGSVFTFTGTEFTSSGLLNGETIGSVTLSSAGSPATAGVSGSPYAITASAPTDGTFNAGNYNIGYTTGILTVNKANATINIIPYTVTYDGAAHSATISAATGVLGEDFTGDIVLNTTHTNAGTYNTDSWSFAGNSNYNADGATITDLINTASSSITVTGSNTYTYSGIPQGPVTSTETGSTGAITYSYSGAVSTTYGPSATLPTDAGNYTVTATVAADANFDAAISAVFPFSISKADAVISVSPYGTTYDGNAHTSVFTAVGVESTPSDLTSLMDVNATAHTNAGIYNGDAWTFAGNNNYNSVNGTVDNSIGQANAVITVSPYGVAYDGVSHTSAFTAVGVESTPADLSSLMNVSATTHTDAGTYNGDAWSFAGNINYSAANGTVDNSIGKADAIITVSTYGVTYDGNAHTSAFAAIGIESPTPVDLTSFMDVSATTHTDAGTYTGDAWTFAGNNNYNSTTGTVNNSIGKANAVITVTPYNVTYDALPHTSVFTAVGIESPTPVDLTSLMNVSATTHINAGTYAGDGWTFAGNNNYSSANGSVNNEIGQAAITVTADPQTKVYGAIDPALTYQLTSGALAGTDAFTGALTRASGEAAGIYPISQGTLALSNDYNLGYIGNSLTITNIPIVASASAGIVECAGGTTTLTVTASGGDGTLRYSLNGGSYQSSNIFTVDAAGSPYIVTVEDADGFTQNTNSVTVTEKPSPTISLSTPVETSNQTICIGGPIAGISYLIGGNTTGATVSALPSGLTGTYDPLTQTFNITGTPDNPGSYSYTVTTTGPCTNLSLGGTVLVNDDATISASTPTDQTVCINGTFDNIIFSIGGGANNAIVLGLPNGLTGSYDSGTGLFTISGSPTVSGTFTYIVNTDGPCDKPSAGGTITVNANSSIVLSSVTGTDAQTVCSNSPVINIVYAIDDGATGAHVTGLPLGVTGSYNGGTQLFTISGTPTQSPVQTGSFNYTVTTEGPCVNPTMSGSITINPVATVNSIGNQVVCDGILSVPVNFSSPTPLGGGSITYSWANDNTSIGLAANGTGDIVAFSATNNGTIPITGNITVTPHYTNNSVTCDGVPVTFTITVNANSTIGLASANESANQTVCINTAISDIQYSIGGGGTGAHVSGLPAGVAGSYNAGVFTISGTPIVSGTFNYVVTTDGPCVNVSLGGTITINANSTIALSSAANTDNQTVCINTGISIISYTIGGGATSASMTEGSLPAGVTGSFSGGVFTISGTPTEAGVFTYKIVATGPCVDASTNGTITVNPTPVANQVGDATYCNNSGGAAINFSTPTPGGTVTYTWSSSADVGFGTTGNGNISSFTATNNSNSPVTATITVTPHYTNNSVTCGGLPMSFNITVNPTPVVNAVTNKTYCNNTQGEAVSFSSPTTGGIATYSWTSSSNIGFGTTGSGNIPAYTAANNSINPVTATITVTPSLNGCTGAPVTFTITVNPSANAGTISGSSTMCINTTTQLSTNGSLGGTWTSSNQGVATVNAATGLVTSVSQGSTTIYYTVTNICGASSSSFTINVNSTANAGTISGSATVCSGSSVVYTSDGNSGGLWFSANPSVATVNSAGVVTGVNGGTTTIYYYVSTPTCGSANTSANITVTSGGNPGIILGSSTLCAGAATVMITTGNSGGIWASTNPGVASIDPNNGFLIAQSAGSTIISYTLPSNSCSSGPLVAYFNLNVNPSGNAGAISGNGVICVGSSTLLTSNGSSGGTWISGNSLVATVNPNTGVVTGVGTGNVLITYFVSNTCGNGSAVFPVSVSVGANAGSLSGLSSVCAGSTINLVSSGNPGGVWSSSNSNAIVDANGLAQGINAGTAVITYTVTSACSSSSISTTITINPVPVSGTVSGAATVCAGLSTPFTSNGDGGGSWSSSNPLVASVNSTSGVVTGLASGNTVITYTLTTGCGTVSSSSPAIIVNPVLNAGMISGGASVCMGAALQLSASGNTGGQWTSSDASKATVDANTGTVTSVSPGNTTITYTVSNGCGTSTATQLVTVTALVNAGTISGASSICDDASTTYSSNGTSGGTWISSNTAVATIDAASGVVTGVSMGTATITYMVTNNCGTKTATHFITVNPLPGSAAITGPNDVCINGTINLTSNIPGGTWHSNSPTIATVNTSGQVSGASGGTATITYTLTTSCGSNVASYTVAVNSVPFAGIINGPSTLCVGALGFFTDMGGASGGIWRSTKPSVASVDPVTGEVTAISAGNTVIVYTVTNSCGSSNAAQTVFVNSLPNAGTVSGPSSVCALSTINMSASGDAGGVWTSNNTLVATVDPTSGVVTGVGQGTASIIYTVGSVAVCGTSASSQLITVNPLANAGAISGTTTFCTGLSSTLVSTGTVGGTWGSSNSTVAAVDPVSGVVTGVGTGTAIINYTVTNICGSKTASVPVTINPLPTAGTISGATSVCVGTNINLSNNVSGGTWSSSTQSVATVDPNTGVVTGVGQGNTTITYTVTTMCGTASTNYTVTVNPVPNAGSITGINYLCVGSTATWYSNMAGGTWGSSNTSAATVNPTTGVVTGIGAGSSTISYTVSSVCGISVQSSVVTIGDYPNAGTVSGVSVLCTNSTAIFTSNGTGGGSWSSNSAAAAVDPLTGTVTGVTAGSATITYTVSSTCGSSSSSANITITALPNAGTVSGAASLCSGSLTTFSSSGTTGGNWSSNNNLVATVNPTTGVVTGVGVGTATISYMVTNTCGTATATEDITINALPNSGTVSGAASLCAASTTAFTSTGDGGGIWSSSDPSVATVNPVTGAVTGVAAGAATISYKVISANCGSSISSSNITINPLPSPGLVSGASSVCVNATTTLTTSGSAGGSWDSDNTAIATVDAVTGMVSGVSSRSTTITYTVTNGCGTAGAIWVITVDPLPNSGAISGAGTVCVNSTTTFTSDGLSGTWSSDDESVATVDANSGLVTGVAPGNANIIYTVNTPCGTTTSSAPVTVIILPDAGTVSGATTICAGSTTSYTSSGLNGGTWNSSDITKATVDPNTGEVTGVSAGSTTITYTFTNSCGTSTASQSIAVNPLPDGGTVSGAATVCIGATATYSSDGLSGGTWASSDLLVATVDPNTGVVTGLAAGTSTITYTSNTPCGMATASSDIEVVVTPNAGTVSGSATVCVGAYTTYTSDGLSGGTWSSDSPDRATVDPITGVVTGVKAGNATIRYTFANSCGTNSSSQLIVVNPLPDAGTVTGATAVCVGSIATFTSDGLAGGSWISSNPAVASVNPTSGVVTGMAQGSATITYESNTPCGTQSASANITVNPVLTAGSVTGATTLCIGSSTTYTSDGSGGGTWESVTPSVATVNPNTGVVTGITTGNATIKYTVSSSCGTSSSSQMIAVSLAANPGTISGSSSICTGSSSNFSHPGGVNGGVWISSNTAVATVNSSGKVTGIAAGSAVITYSVSSGCGPTDASKNITVTESLSVTANNITVNTDPNKCNALVDLGNYITTAGSPTLEYRIGYYFFSWPISSTHTFYRGTTPVTVIARNACGITARIFLVTVVDNEAPVVACKPNATRAANGNSSRYSVQGNEFNATATDGCGVASLIYSLSGATTDNFDRHNTSLNHVRLNIGTTTITWKATDVNGNVSTCSFTVTVTGGGNNFGRKAEDETLKVKVAPNPSSFYFTLQFESESGEKVNLTVVDVMGRAIEQVKGVDPNGTIQIGSKYRPGTYIVHAVQGGNTVSAKLIKEGKLY